VSEQPANVEHAPVTANASQYVVVAVAAAVVVVVVVKF
jgi:hypothetical protein